MFYMIEFDSVFDASIGVKVLNEAREVPLERDHDHGVLKLRIDEQEYSKLLNNKVRFSILNHD